MIRMRKLAWTTILLGSLFFAGCGCHHRHHHRPCCDGPCAMQQAAAPTAEGEKALHNCDCGAQCKCNGASAVPGNCPCGKPMKKAE